MKIIFSTSRIYSRISEPRKHWVLLFRRDVPITIEIHEVLPSRYDALPF